MEERVDHFSRNLERFLANYRRGLYDAKELGTGRKLSRAENFLEVSLRKEQEEASYLVQMKINQLKECNLRYMKKISCNRKKFSLGANELILGNSDMRHRIFANQDAKEMKEESTKRRIEELEARIRESEVRIATKGKFLLAAKRELAGLRAELGHCRGSIDGVALHAAAPSGYRAMVAALDDATRRKQQLLAMLGRVVGEECTVGNAKSKVYDFRMRQKKLKEEEYSGYVASIEASLSATRIQHREELARRKESYESIKHRASLVLEELRSYLSVTVGL